MQQTSVRQLLDIWDRGRAASGPLQRTLEMLRVSRALCPEPAALPLGDRDARLLDLYEDLFGRELAALVTCTNCGEELEVRVSVQSVRTEAPARGNEWHLIEHATGPIEFRLPTSLDLLGVANVQGNGFRRARLFGRLVRRTGASAEPPLSLPEELQEEIEHRMAELDPQADIRLSLHCDVCENAFQCSFDIGSFLWTEFDGWARQTLRDVHTLARGYGWSEASILELDPKRRQMYVEMLIQ